jgi:alkylation response protein AidB-like acyl-CoA dehydrogenase
LKAAPPAGARAPTGEVLVAAAQALAPRISAAADEIERTQLLPRELVDELYDAGLFNMLLPASLGGSETDLLAFARAVEEIARADASVAWCVGQANGLWNYVAYLDPSAARDLIVGQRTILANGPGEGNRPGRAVEADGGYTVTGRWMFASGIGHATWLVAVCHLFSADGEPRLGPDGKNVQRFLAKSRATLHDAWHVSGLRGTGSQSFSVADVFVPSDYVLHFLPYSPEARTERGPLYLFTNNGIFAPAFASVALGIAHTSLADLIDLAAGKVPRLMERSIRESPTVQAAVATAQARLGAARIYLHTTLAEVWAAAARDGELTFEQRAAERLAAIHAMHEAAAVVDTAYTLAGSNAIFEHLPFERRFRDVHAVTQQLQGRKAHYEYVGRTLLGLEPELGAL